MSIHKIQISCDTPGCWAHCSTTTTTTEAARDRAADWYGWTRLPDGADICGPCGRGDTPQAHAEATQ